MFYSRIFHYFTSKKQFFVPLFSLFSIFEHEYDLHHLSVMYFLGDFNGHRFTYLLIYVLKTWYISLFHYLTFGRWQSDTTLFFTSFKFAYICIKSMLYSFTFLLELLSLSVVSIESNIFCISLDVSFIFLFIPWYWFLGLIQGCHLESS